MRWAVVVAIVLAVGVLVHALREETMTVHTSVPSDSKLELVVSATSRHDRGVERATRAQLQACAMEASNEVELTELATLGEGRFAAVFQPSLDEPDTRQFVGCVQDLRMRLFLFDVEEVRGTVGLDPGEDID